MRGAGGTRLTAAAVAVVLLGLPGAGGAQTPTVRVPGEPGARKSAAAVRAQRRAYDGAPPVIPHESFGSSCVTCHDRGGVEVQGVGFAPPSPHDLTGGGGALSRCTQCHVFRRAKDAFVDNSFSGLRQDLRHGTQLHPYAPPRMPHPVQMRENCGACHAGPAAREEIRTPHPERANCRQCHVPIRTGGRFVPVSRAE